MAKKKSLDTINEDEIIEDEPKSKSEERRVEIQKTEKKVGKVLIRATRNAYLPDNTFVKTGKEVEVDTDYWERCKKEGDTRFTLVKS